MPRGRVPMLDFDLKLRLLELAEAGLTDREIAEAVGCSVDTLYLWRRKDLDLFRGFAAARELADDRVERSLYQNAVGYEVEAVKVFCKDGEVTYAPYTEYVKPDTTAQIKWLEQRKMAEWQRREQSIEATVNVVMDPREVARRVAAVLIEGKLKVSADEQGSRDA